MYTMTSVFSKLLSVAPDSCVNQYGGAKIQIAPLRVLHTVYLSWPNLPHFRSSKNVADTLTYTLMYTCDPVVEI